MFRLFLIVYAIAGPSLAGSVIVAALVIPQLLALTGVFGAGLIGFALAVPAAWIIARKISHIAEPRG